MIEQSNDSHQKFISSHHNLFIWQIVCLITCDHIMNQIKLFCSNCCMLVIVSHITNNGVYINHWVDFVKLLIAKEGI